MSHDLGTRNSGDLIANTIHNPKAISIRVREYSALPTTNGKNVCGRKGGPFTTRGVKATSAMATWTEMSRAFSKSFSVEIPDCRVPSPL